MKLYHDLTQCSFLCRVNRFIARCLVNGEETTVHVKNTGRLRELLIPGTLCWLEKSANPNRKTLYDLVNEGLHQKIAAMPEDARLKLADTLSRIINEGSTGLICILL